MNQRLRSDFHPSSFKARLACAVGAVAVSLAMLTFVDALTHGIGTSASPRVQSTPVVCGPPNQGASPGVAVTVSE